MPATQGDAAQIAEIYGHHVLHGTASFEIVPPTPAEMAARIARVVDGGWPWLVARDGVGNVTGYAYAAPMHARAAYRFTCEDSIYIRHDRRGEGIGTALLAALLPACEASGFRQIVALIAGTEPASVIMHARAGFIEVGRLRDVGRKHGQWIDVLHMQRALGAGASNAPEVEPR